MALKHFRIAPTFDVSMCGLRDVEFTAKPVAVTCPDCLSRRRDPKRRAAGLARWRKENAGRKRKGIGLPTPP